ncbi:hypothetical protein RBI14_17050 [Alcaligenaceae bacterium B3P038]|nr:hypothetical protein [Alcaligenaceae bacterium B3P038]
MFTANTLRLLAVIFGLAIYVRRVRSAIWNPYLYAEDGKVFLQEQLIHGASALTMPFAGYLHAVPRLTALAASPFSATLAPAIYAGINMVVMVWTLVTIAFCRVKHAPLLAALLFMVPHTGEVFGTITNAQWVMACALPLIAMTETPLGRLNRMNQLAFLLLAGLSGPFSIFALPIFVWRLWTNRDAHSIRLFSVALVVASTQLITTLRNYVSFEGEREPLHLAITVLDRWLGALANGWRSDNWYFVLITILFGITLLFLVWSPKYRRLNLALLFMTGAVLGSTWLKFMPGHSRHLDWISMDDRYFFIPKVMTFWILAGALFQAERVRQFAGAVLLMLGLMSVKHGEYNWWRKHIYPELPWSTPALEIDKGNAVEIFINPAPYSVQVPDRK